MIVQLIVFLVAVMTLSHNRKLFAVALFTVIVPISLLTTFKITGIMPESPLTQIIPCKPADIEIRRPFSTLELDKEVENICTNNEATARVRVGVTSYRENSPTAPYLNRDGVSFTIYINFSVTQGFGVSLVLKHLPTDESASIYIDSDFWIQHNVSVIEMKQFGASAQEGYIKAKILNVPCYLKLQVYWVFDDENAVDHLLVTTLEATYFNGTIYQKIVLPVHIFVSCVVFP